MNVAFGALVIEKSRNVLVCKTFLTPDMLRDNVEWRHLDSIEVAGEDYFHMSKLTDLFEHKSEHADPLFYANMGAEGPELISSIAHLYYEVNRKFSSR